MLQGAQVITGQDGWFFRANEPRIGLNAVALRAVSGLVGEAVAVLRRAEVTVLLQITPLRARTYRDRLPAGVTLSAETEGRYGAAIRTLGPLAPVVDVGAIFAARRALPDAPLLFFKADSHWTPTGAGLAARAMAETIGARVPLPASARPGARLGPPQPLQNLGDLSAIMTEAQRRAAPPEMVEARRVVPPSGVAALLAPEGDEPPDVVVVGSSFLQPTFTYAAQLSEALRRPVGLTWLVHPVGPYRTLLRAVSEEGFRRKRPKVLVWHLLEGDVDAEPTRADIWTGNTMTGAAFLAELRRALGG